MVKHSIKLLLISLLIFGMQCRDTEPTPVNPIDQLPPATQTGENTIGYLLNGEAITITNTSKMTAIYQQGILIIGSSKDDDIKELGMSITLREAINIGNPHTLTNPPTSKAVYSITLNSIPSICFYEENDTYSGSLTITFFDPINFIVSGLFEYSTANDMCDPDTIVVTNGRFDMQYIP